MTTLANIVSSCRQRYNAVGDNFFSDEEMYDLVYEAEMAIANECEAIEEIYTTSTVASQREYDFPTRAIRIQRITYAGERLAPIDFLEDDQITGSAETTTSTGDPLYYAIFANRIFLRPVPASVGTLKIYAIVMPSQPTAITSSMTIPEQYRLSIKDFILSQMSAKDKNIAMFREHDQLWQRSLAKIKSFEMKRQVGDAYKIVKNCDDNWG